MFGVLLPLLEVTCSIIRLMRVTTGVSRAGSGTFSVPTIIMGAAHSVSDAGVTQYFLTNSLIGASVSSVTASPTVDSWYDSGSSVNVVLSYVWGASSSTRSNLFNYTVDGVTTANVARSGSGTFNVPTITMGAAHSVGDGAKTQYFLTNTLVGGSVNSITASPTVDSWYDAGSGVNVVLNYVWGAVVSVRGVTCLVTLLMVHRLMLLDLVLVRLLFQLSLWVLLTRWVMLVLLSTS